MVKFKLQVVARIWGLWLNSVQFSKPSAITTDITWNTMAFSSPDYPDEIGKLIINGTCTSACTVDVILVHEEGW